jgi:hypothetical protein
VSRCHASRTHRYVLAIATQELACGRKFVVVVLAAVCTVPENSAACVRRLPHAACSGGFPPPSPPAEKATARQDQSRQSSTGDGARHGSNECFTELHTEALEKDKSVEMAKGGKVGPTTGKNTSGVGAVASRLTRDGLNESATCICRFNELNNLFALNCVIFKEKVVPALGGEKLTEYVTAVSLVWLPLAFHCPDWKLRISIERNGMNVGVTKTCEGAAETAPFVADELKLRKLEYVAFPHEKLLTNALFSKEIQRECRPTGVCTSWRGSNNESQSCAQDRGRH